MFRIGFLPVVLVAALMLVPLTAGAQPTPEEVNAAIAKGVAWLAAQQNDLDGSWGENCAKTALAVKKLMHHAVDPKYGLGNRFDSPFDPNYAYVDNIEAGLDYLFSETCAEIREKGVCFDCLPAEGPPPGWHETYTTGIALMTLCEAVDLDRKVEGGPLNDWTYEEVARGTMDWLAYGQIDLGIYRGGWGHAANAKYADNSNTGYATLGLGFAEAQPPEGCGFEVPQVVKDQLDDWIDYIQNDVGVSDNHGCDHSGVEWGDCDGGSGYGSPDDWVNILQTVNLLQQMSFVGDDETSTRVQDALGYMERHWDDADQDPGWMGDGGSSSYQATFTAMKEFTSLGIETFGDPAIDWQTDFETELLAEQKVEPVYGPDDLEYGSWPWCNWDDSIPCTTWALLTLQKAPPPPPSEPGRMTGGGSVLTQDRMRVTHGFERFPQWATIYVFVGERGIPRYRNVQHDAGYREYKRPARIGTRGGRAKAEFRREIERAARTYGVDAALIAAIIRVESDFHPEAVSPEGAQGLMQLMPGTTARFNADDPFDPHENIDTGVRYLAYLFQLFKGHLPLVLAAYNAGERRVLQHGGVPPFPETRAYVRRVLAEYAASRPRVAGQ